MPRSTNVNPIPGLDGGIAPGHTDAQLKELRAMTADARHRQASHMPPASATGPQDGPPQAGRIDVTLAGRARDKRIGQLQAALQGYLREADRFPAAMSGVVDPYQADRQRSLRAAADGVRVDIRELSELSGPALVDWAERAGVIRFKQDGSAII